MRWELAGWFLNRDFLAVVKWQCLAWEGVSQRAARYDTKSTVVKNLENSDNGEMRRDNENNTSLALNS